MWLFKLKEKEKKTVRHFSFDNMLTSSSKLWSYAQMRRSICTSEPRRASTRVSSGFILFEHSSPSFGSHRTRSDRNGAESATDRRLCATDFTVGGSCLWVHFRWASLLWSAEDSRTRKAINTIYAIASIEASKIHDFNGVWTRDLAIPVRHSNQLSYEATDIGSWSFVGSLLLTRNKDQEDRGVRDYLTRELKTKQHENITVYDLITHNSLHCRKVYWYKLASKFVNSEAFLNKFSLLLRCGLSSSAGNLLNGFCFFAICNNWLVRVICCAGNYSVQARGWCSNGDPSVSSDR